MSTSFLNRFRFFLTFMAVLLLESSFAQTSTAAKDSSVIYNGSAKIRGSKYGYSRCGTVEYEQYLQRKNPKRITQEQFEKWIGALVSAQADLRKKMRTGAGVAVVKIPVVVHVIHNGQNIGIAPNISDAQIQSQITVLNQDFRKILGTAGYNTNPVGADTEIEFELATQDPLGNPTNGIDRIDMCAGSWSEQEINEIVKPKTFWDPDLYLNFWIVQITGKSFLGFAQYPDASTLSGISSSNGPARTDGIVISYDNFGSVALGSNFLLEPGYDRGRTATHEVGHFLGLKHIWGDGTGDAINKIPDCTASDFCNDTPQSGYEHYDCNRIYDTCPASPGNDMVENYMDYSLDSCMNIFTLNQKTRMITVLDNSARRKTLKTSTKANPIPLFQNDAEIKCNEDFCSVAVKGCSQLLPQSNKKVTIYNRGTNAINTLVFSYVFNNLPVWSQTWTGSLAPSESVVLTLNNTNFSGVLKLSIDSVNGVIDERSSNNIDTKSYGAVNYGETNFVFNLQLDYWGSETTWSLKNSTGLELYKGGPYKDKSQNSNNLPALITDNWSLQPNQCYTFTINDNKEDGLCCSGGLGYYNIKTSDGLQTIKAGGSFWDNEITFFSTNTLGLQNNGKFEDEYLFPNPAKDIITIISNTLIFPNSIELFNNLGQKILSKEVKISQDLNFDISKLAVGTYFLSLVKENKTTILKFIKY